MSCIHGRSMSSTCRYRNRSADSACLCVEGETCWVLAASDFFAVEVWSWSGLMTYYVLFVMELATRRICIAGITTHPDTQWMLQMARQLTDGIDGILLDKRYIILDRDTKYCQAFRDFLKREGIAVIRLPPRSPNLNAHAERWVRGARDECLSRLIPICLLYTSDAADE